MGESIVHVMAGVIRDGAGRVLLAQRPAGKHLAGLWEFPGGKVDPGESPLDALRRELVEEIGVAVESARPLISIPWTYPEKRIVLDAWIVDACSGSVQAREGQALQWAALDALDTWPMPPADRPIVTALRLPDRHLITPSLPRSATATLLEGIERACSRGVRLIQLRQPDWPREEVASAAPAAHAICARHGAALLVNADVDLAMQCGLDGVHLPARLAARLDARPIAADRWLGVSCHDAAELERARLIGADFATLGPVAATPSHPDAKPIGWAAFAALVRDAALPVYALGGLGAADIPAARASGAQGVAAIRAFWP